MSAGLLDTSAIIGGLAGELPERLAVSVMTVAELQVGVLTAPDEERRAARLRRLGDVQRTFAVLDVDAQVGLIYADLRARTGRRAVADLVIAATAIVHGMLLVTRDADQAKLLGARGVLIT